MKDDVDELKKAIMETLRKHPEGLTILELAKVLGRHRQTVTKYILVLEATGQIHRRRVGSATLHYPKEMFAKRAHERELSRK